MEKSNKTFTEKEKPLLPKTSNDVKISYLAVFTQLIAGETATYGIDTLIIGM